MGEIADKREVLETVFQQYDLGCKGELTPIEVQTLHSDIRMGGISYPQVIASMKYACATENCDLLELYDLMQEMDRRYFLIQDLRWEFSFLDRELVGTITEDQARWMVQAVYGKHFSRRKWNHFVKNRAMPGSRVAFAEIEVILCNLPDCRELKEELEEEERERQERLRREKLAEEEAERERELRRKQREDERRRKEEERKRQEELRRKQLLDDEDQRQQEEEARKRKLEQEIFKFFYYLDQEREREAKRLRELEELNREEEERRRKEEEEKYKDVEKIAEEAERMEKEYLEKLEQIRKKKREATDAKTRREAEEEEERLMRKYQEFKHKRIRYKLKVAIKSRDTYELEYSINEFEKEKVEDVDLELEKAKKLLKELTSKDNLRRAMSKREIEEIEKAIETVKKHGLEAKLAKELIEAENILHRLRRLARIRSEILELKQSTVAEIRSYQKPPQVVHVVMTATFLLLGHSEKETKNWKTVQALVGKTGKEGLKRRCLELDASKLDLAVAQRSKELLKGHELDEVRDVSAGAATFYVWSTTMIEEAVDIAESGGPPSSSFTPVAGSSPAQKKTTAGPKGTSTTPTPKARSRSRSTGRKPAK